MSVWECEATAKNKAVSLCCRLVVSYQNQDLTGLEDHIFGFSR